MPVNHIWIYLHILVFLEFILWSKCRVGFFMDKNCTRWDACINARIWPCACSWFQTGLGGYSGLMDKRSMTSDIPLPHDSSPASCSHVDNMCCFDFCLWNLPAKQDHEQKSCLNVPRRSFLPPCCLPLSDLQFNQSTREHSHTDKAVTKDMTLSWSAFSSQLAHCWICCIDAL